MTSHRKHTIIGWLLVLLLCLDSPVTKLLSKDDSSLVEAQKMRTTLSNMEAKLESKSVPEEIMSEYKGKIVDLRTEVDSLILSEQQKLEWNLWGDIGKPLFWLIVIIGYFKCIKPAEQDAAPN